MIIRPVVASLRMAGQFHYAVVNKDNAIVALTIDKGLAAKTCELASQYSWLAVTIEDPEHG